MVVFSPGLGFAGESLTNVLEVEEAPASKGKNPARANMAAINKSLVNFKCPWDIRGISLLYNTSSPKQSLLFRPACNNYALVLRAGAISIASWSCLAFLLESICEGSEVMI